MARVNIKKFDPSKMRPNAIVLLIGKRGTGKSTLLKLLSDALRFCFYHVLPLNDLR